MSGALVDLANLAVTQVGLQAIDWAALTAAGRGSVWDRDYILNYMVPAQVKMQAAAALLDLDFNGNADTLQQSYSLNEDLLTNMGELIASMGNPATFIVMKVEARLSREAIRYLIIHVYNAALYGALLHMDETIHHSGKSDQEIQDHANAIVGMMNAVTMLGSLDFYTVVGITTANDQAGLGIATPLLIAAVVVAIAALALLAWLIISLRSTSAMNATVSTMCQKAQASGDTSTTQLCVNTLTAASKGIGTVVPDTLNQMLKTVLPYALAGVGMYMLVLFAPSIVKSIAAGRSTA